MTESCGWGKIEEKTKEYTCVVTKNLRAILRKLSLVTMPLPGPRPRLQFL